MTSHRDDGVSRRKILECMTWAGTGMLWTVAGGVPRSVGIIGDAQAAPASGLTFLQITDSHVGFDKPANPNALGTLEEAIAKINAMPVKPAFMIHTGDITHLSKASGVRRRRPRLSAQARLPCILRARASTTLSTKASASPTSHATARARRGSGWYSFDQNGVHFIGLVNVMNLKAGGFGNLGNEQLEWLEDDVKGLAASTPIVVFAHVPLWTVYPQWGWGTEDGSARARLPQAVRLGDGPQRPHPPDHAEGRGQRDVSHRAVDGVPAAGAGQGALAWTDEGRRREAAFAARRRRCHFHARERAARDHRQAAARLKRVFGDQSSSWPGLARPSTPWLPEERRGCAGQARA